MLESYVIKSDAGYVSKTSSLDDVAYVQEVNRAKIFDDMEEVNVFAANADVTNTLTVIKMTIGSEVMTSYAPKSADDNVAVFSETPDNSSKDISSTFVPWGRDMNTVNVSDATVHPVDMYSTYKDIITGTEGKCVGVAYMSSGGILVLLKWAGKEGSRTEGQYFELSEIEPVDGAKYEPDMDIKLPVQMRAKYKEVDSDFEGKLTSITFSGNKCIQVSLTKAKDGKYKDTVFDLQDVEPVEPNVPKHNVTNDTNPGAPMMLPPGIRDEEDEDEDTE